MCIDENAHCGGPDHHTHYRAQEAQIRAKKEEIISKLENGIERYQVDSLTYNIVEYLARGADPIVIIDRLLKSHAEMVAELIKMRTYDARPVSIHVSKEQADEFLKTIKKIDHESNEHH